MGEKFIKEIYTSKEIEYCESKKNAKYQHYAARFAAKEAIYKSVSKIKDDFNFWEVEILNDDFFLLIGYCRLVPSLERNLNSLYTEHP